MHVELAPELQEYVSESVASGAYASSIDVVAAGIHLLRQQETAQSHLDELKREISLGIEQAGRGDLLDGDRFIGQMLAHHESCLA